MKRNRATEIAYRRVLIDFHPEELIQHLTGMIFSIGGAEHAGPRPSDAAQLGRQGLERKTNGRVGFDSDRMQCVEELPALAVEQPIGSETCDGSDCACKFIG